MIGQEMEEKIDFGIPKITIREIDFEVGIPKLNEVMTSVFKISKCVNFY